jgi:ParB-like chromosome segregation protein Spo0J
MAGAKRASVEAAPARAIETWALSRLRPYARNPREHEPGQVEQIAASMREYGWTMPLLIDEGGMILAGHGRFLAAELLGRSDAPVIVARGWSDAQKRAYVIADNKLSENSRWDENLLALELEELRELGVEASLMGMEDEELARLLGEGEDAAAPLKVREIETGPVQDEFWISVRGPLASQAEALERLRGAMAGLMGVKVELGTTELEA